jgi:RNA ligase (TIGR02306 family)
MTTVNVRVYPLVIEPHPSSERLAIARIGLFQAIVGADQYRTGDYAAFIPVGAIVPDDLLAEIGLTGKLAGPQFNRVKAMHLRDVLSQGIVCSPEALNGVNLVEASEDGTDFAELLGVTAWNPAVPEALVGQVEPCTKLVQWIEIPDLRMHPEGLFEPGEQVMVTEKIHGTHCAVTYDVASDTLYVSSKELSHDRMALTDTEGVYWRAVEAHGLRKAARNIALGLDASRVGLFGEVYGKDIQDLHYSRDLDSPGYVLFDVRVQREPGITADDEYDRVNSMDFWLNPHEVASAAMVLSIPLAPVLWVGPFSVEKMIELADGTETLTGDNLHTREGIVVRPVEERYTPLTESRRAIAKLHGATYLTREGGTEYS